MSQDQPQKRQPTRVLPKPNWELLDKDKFDEKDVLRLFQAEDSEGVPIVPKPHAELYTQMDPDTYRRYQSLKRSIPNIGNALPRKATTMPTAGLLDGLLKSGLRPEDAMTPLSLLGMFDSSDNSIWVGPPSRVNDPLETLLHELVHSMGFSERTAQKAEAPFRSLFTRPK